VESDTVTGGTRYYDDEAQPGLNPWLLRLPVLVITGVLLLMLALIAFAGAVQLRFNDTIVPGVWSNGVNLGGLTPAEAENALRESFSYPTDAVFTFRDSTGNFWQLTAAELGVELDASATIAQAMGAGHGSNILFNLVEQASIWMNGQNVPPVVRYDENVAAAKLLEIAEAVNTPPVDGSLDINGIFVTTSPGQTGRTLDIQTMLGQLEAVILRLDTGAEIPLVIRETPPLVTDTEAAAARARAAVSHPITLIAEGPDGQQLGPWSATPEQIARLLQIEPSYNGDGTVSYNVGVNIEAFRQFLMHLAPGVVMEPRNARFHFNDNTRELEVFEPGVSGRELNVEETLRRLETAVFNPDPNARSVPIAFSYNLPQYHNGITALELGITELVAQATTYYTGSTQNRILNIIEATQRFDGVMIAPGEEFSFNDLLGPISPEDGFTEGFVIIGDRTVQGVGGGVCQVSTTAFQAAFKAGFPFTEWYAHGYRVGYYERGEGVGMDAAIYQSDNPAANLDLRFVNDTPYHLLIETSIFPGDDAVQFRFYSTNPGRQVIKSGPQISDVRPPRETRYVSNPEITLGQERWVDWPAEGAYVVVERAILDSNGQEIRRDIFRRNYQPWGAVIQVNPVDPRLPRTSG
jgi:vancomycin resistance protein YoaR